MNDNDVETTQEVDDVARFTDLFDLHEVKSDNLADLGSDDTGFGQHEIEENDVKNESSTEKVIPKCPIMKYPTMKVPNSKHLKNL